MKFKVFIHLGITVSAITIFTGTALAQTPSTSEMADCKKVAKNDSVQSERVGLNFYRDTQKVIEILKAIPFSGSLGCAVPLSLSSFTTKANDSSGKEAVGDGIGVGRGGGNVLLLYGDQEYTQSAKRLIALLDLPLNGIDLQLWGVQISSNSPNRLAEAMIQVRARINETDQLLANTVATIQGGSKFYLQANGVDDSLQKIVAEMGYETELKGLDTKTMLDVYLTGITVKSPENFYKSLYQDLVEGSIENGKFVAKNERLQPYYDSLRKLRRAPFENFFRSRGFQPHCDVESLETIQKNGKEVHLCEQWSWKPVLVGGGKISLVDITKNYERKIVLEFLHQYIDVLNDPKKFDPDELNRTSDALNALLKNGTDVLQKDIEDLFVQPTLAMLQEIVRHSKKVSFAQVGRSKISTLDGIPTQFNTSSTSAFQTSQSKSLDETLETATKLEQKLNGIIPAGTAVGALPTSKLVGLLVALSQETIKPVEIKTGTNITFTSGISRDLNSSELNIMLDVTNPEVTATAQDNSSQSNSLVIPNFSRIGKQTVSTRVYTQALDFFDLSTFASQATLDGGRFRIPVIGQIWHAIFAPIPRFGDLFSFPRGNQTRLHESLILTTSFITPTPWSIARLYPPESKGNLIDFCARRMKLNEYFKASGIAGNTVLRYTPSVKSRNCPP